MAYEYFDDEYANYDATAEELKAALIKSVKKEIKEKIEKLEKENSELREKQSNLKKLEQDASEKVRLAEQKQAEAGRNGLQVRARELIEAIQKPAFRLHHSYVEQPKCDKCGDDRTLQFIYPSGKQGAEYCECRHS